MWGGVDWGIFSFSMPVLEIIVRGTVVYLALFCLLRLLKRQGGGLSMPDLLLVVMIADAAQNAMAGDSHTIGDGLLLVVTILFWSFVLDWLAQCSPLVRSVVHPAPVPLIKNGQLVRKNMQHELISKDELMSQLREQGIEKIDMVRSACLEGDGKISIIPYEQQSKQKGPDSNFH